MLTGINAEAKNQSLKKQGDEKNKGCRKRK
jgi:hypothetical protein